MELTIPVHTVTVDYLHFGWVSLYIYSRPIVTHELKGGVALSLPLDTPRESSNQELHYSYYMANNC